MLNDPKTQKLKNQCSMWCCTLLFHGTPASKTQILRIFWAYLTGLMSVPSLSTLEGVKKYINAVGNTPSAIAPKQTVMLDWASKEDGSHILTITVGNKVNMYIKVVFLTSCPSKYDKIKTVGKWGIWTHTGVLVGYYPPTLGVEVWGSLDPPKGV